jgi:hypothetical protein
MDWRALVLSGMRAFSFIFLEIHIKMHWDPAYKSIHGVT